MSYKICYKIIITSFRHDTLSKDQYTGRIINWHRTCDIKKWSIISWGSGIIFGTFIGLVHVYCTQHTQMNCILVSLCVAFGEYRTILSAFCKWYFLKWKLFIFSLNVTEVCSQWCSWPYVSTGCADSGFDVYPVRRQTITWNNMLQIRTGDYALFPPQPPSSLVMRGTEWPKHE